MITPYSPPNPLLNDISNLNFSPLNLSSNFKSNQTANKISKHILLETHPTISDTEYLAFIFFSNKSFTSLSELENLLNVYPEGLTGDLLHILTDIAQYKLMHNQIGFHSYFNIPQNKLLLPLSTYNHLDLGKNCEVTSYTILLAAQLFLNTLAIKKSYNYAESSSLIKPALMGLFGIYGVLSTLIQIDDLYRGFHFFSELEEPQQNAVLKYKAMPIVAKAKPCNAVIIDEELNSDSGKGSSLPLGVLLYDSCRTQAFAVNSEQTFCKVLQEAKNYFNASIDKLILHGPANRASITLDKGYNFTANDYTLKCLDENLKADAQIFALGSNTATTDPSSETPSIAERISNYLPNRTITGLKGYFNRYLSLQQFKEGILSIKAFATSDSNGAWVLGNSAVNLQNSKVM